MDLSIFEFMDRDGGSAVFSWDRVSQYKGMGYFIYAIYFWDDYWFHAMSIIP